ncbi:MAG TPA: hypothetical protein VFR90_15985 [Methylibium sp.]|uniref:hypothetical protein n=1 Tax=Methylibium sp. TaxID=2067992 RepID=UPI002DB712FF|nr:hypothetical protein [Methylibium sp.]HEU4460621.1 hypothetical protein [Methylibium sp.]
MHTTEVLSANPFALLMEPEVVFATIEKSGRLGRLQSRICRPLDKPLIPRTADDAIELDDEFAADAADDERLS